MSEKPLRSDWLPYTCFTFATYLSSDSILFEIDPIFFCDIGDRLDHTFFLVPIEMEFAIVTHERDADSSHIISIGVGSGDIVTSCSTFIYDPSLSYYEVVSDISPSLRLRMVEIYSPQEGHIISILLEFFRSMMKDYTTHLLRASYRPSELMDTIISSDRSRYIILDVTEDDIIIFFRVLCTFLLL